MNFEDLYKKYQEEGCIKIENFLNHEEVETLRNGVENVLDNITDDVHTHSPYRDSKKKEDEQYYINAGDKVAYFFEDDAFDSQVICLNILGKLIVDKRKALNKVAYALHWWNPNFKKISFSQKIKDLLKAFEYKDPVIVQSMLIFKHPKIGDIFPPHQDSTFLYTEPPSSIGIWLPLEDATIENGCLWYLPGSHKEKIYRRYERTESGGLSLQGDLPAHAEDESKYVPIPAKVGDCVLIHGSVFHKSARNNTTKSRIVYTYHVVENGNPWSELNWLQPTENLPFPSVYKN